MTSSKLYKIVQNIKQYALKVYLLAEYAGKSSETKEDKAGM